MNQQTRISLGLGLAASVMIGAPVLAQINIGPASTIGGLTRAGGATAADFDGDGDLDLATTTDTPDRVNILINGGAGTFTPGPVVFMPNSSSPSELLAGDLDGDGDADLAVILRDFNQVMPLINSGTAAFTLGVAVPVGSEARGMAMADMDGDKDLDIAVANRLSNTATVLTNSGAASFAAATISAGLDPRAVAFGDFDGDVDLDLAVTAHDADSVGIFRNNAGAFVAWTVLSTLAQSPEGVTAGDFEGDGDIDLAVAVGDDAGGQNWAIVYRNLNQGSFGGGVPFVTGGIDTSTITSTDLDCDGLLDLVTVNQTSNNISLLRNTGNASFAAPMLVAVGTTPGEIVAADLDGDQDADLAVANRDSNSMSVLINNTCQPQGVPGDITGDQIVNVDDLLEVIAAWGACAGCAADLTQDGTVNIDDLLLVINNWG